MASILLPFDTNRWDAKEWDLNPHSDLFVGLVACAMPTPEVGLRGLPIDGAWNKVGADGTYGTLRDFLGGQAWMPTNSGIGTFRLTISQSLLTAAPISIGYIGVRFQNYGTTTINIMGVENSASSANRDRVGLLGSAIDKVSLRVASSSGVANGNGILFPVGIVSTAVGVYASATNHWTAAAGQKSTTNTTSMAPTGMDRLYIGSGLSAVWANALKAGLWWNRALSEAEAIELSRDYRVLFRPKKRVLYFTISSPNTVSPSAGSYTFSGQAPTISQPHTVSPGAGSVTALGYAPFLIQGVSVSPGVGAAVYAGQAPTISQPHTVAPSAGAVTVLGYAPSIQQAAGIYPGAGAVEYAGQTPTISQPHTVSPVVGAYDILGYAPTVAQAAGVAPLAGSIIVLGYAPAISQPITVAPGAGAATWLGYAHTISQEAMTLTQADLDAIAAAVWADPAAVAAHAKLDEIIARITC